MMDYHKQVHEHIERAEAGAHGLLVFSGAGVVSAAAGFFWTPAFYGAWAALVACGVTLWGIRKHLRAGRIAAYNDMIHELDGKRLENVAMAFTHPVEARMYKHALDLIREEQWVTDVDDTVAQLENMGDE